VHQYGNGDGSMRKSFNYTGWSFESVFIMACVTHVLWSLSDFPPWSLFCLFLYGGGLACPVLDEYAQPTVWK